jgi:hypothetical protein
MVYGTSVRLAVATTTGIFGCFGGGALLHPTADETRIVAMHNGFDL